MSKILLAARFHVCENCGLHGHIVFSDGSEGEEVASESEALLQLQKAKTDGKLLDVEVSVLKKQIFDSILPPEPTPAILSAIAGLMSSIIGDDDLSSKRSRMDQICLN